jgi:hypothetical protein
MKPSALLKMKWLIAKKVRDNPIRETSFRFHTKLQATKKVSKLNREAKKLGAKVKYMARRVGWRRKRYYS